MTTFSFLALTRRKVYLKMCQHCLGRLYFVFEESIRRVRGELYCVYCGRKQNIWETDDRKEKQIQVHRNPLQEQEEGSTWEAQDEEESPETT